MQLRLDQLAAHLAKGLRRVYTVHGDEPLLVQEAADAIRAAARAAGPAERQVHTVAGAHFDWSGLARRRTVDEPVRRAATDRDPHPLGQAGQGRLRGAAALLRGAVGRRRDARHAAHGSTARNSPAPGSRRSTRRASRCASTRSSAPRCRSGSRSAWPRRASASRLARPGRRRSPSSPTAWKATCSQRTRKSSSSACCTGPASWLRADRGRGAQRRALRRVQARRGGARRPGCAHAAHARRPAGRGRGRRAGALHAGRRHPGA